MIEKFKTTCIIPSFNQEVFLEEAIDSALNQTEQCEVIVIDDGSTDNSLSIAQKYEPRITVISQVNKGLASARNAGIMNAHGDNILPLDADDALLPRCVEVLQMIADGTGAEIISPSFQEFGLGKATVTLMPNPTLDDFKVGNRIGYCSLIKKSALLEVGGYSSRMVEGYEDMHLTINLLTRGNRIVTVPEPLWKYRIKENSMYKDALKHHDKLMNQIYKDFPQVYA